MSKYIIDVGDAYIRHGLERTLTIPVRINEHEDHWMDTRIPVTPYTEPDLEQVKKEAYRQGYDTGYGTKVNEFYEQGLIDAWEAARKLVLDSNHGGLTNYDIEEIFGVDEEQAIINYSASEAIEKIRQYEQEQEQIQVGDEVISPDGKAVVTEISDRNVRIMYSNGSGYVTQLEELTKAGHHFPEIAEVLRKMKEES